MMSANPRIVINAIECPIIIASCFSTVTIASSSKVHTNDSMLRPPFRRRRPACLHGMDHDTSFRSDFRQSRARSQCSRHSTEPWRRCALARTLRELHTRASLIMFTAHPDDEDGGVLTYESRDVGADTSLFTLNRGEGGQNVMSSDFWDQLGILRTEELLKADRYYGVHQYWSRAADFGFTKTKEEAMQKWGYDRVLYDSVRVVRMTRPLVVTSVFSGNVSDGHGQHQVAGQMAQEVYNAAADPKMFPDQIRAGLRPWAPLKMYVRTPFATISSQGVFDYATGHWAPARFRDYINNTWIEGKPTADAVDSGGPV